MTKRASPIELNYEPIKLVKAEAQVQPMRLKSVPLIAEENNIFEEEREFRVGGSYFEEEISLKENEIPLINTSEQGRKPPFNPSDCLIIRHHDHNDYLYQGKLMHLKENGKKCSSDKKKFFLPFSLVFLINLLFLGEWEEHELEANEQNPSVCKPLKEMTHVPNFSDLTAKYKSLIEENKGVLTPDMLSNSCNVLLCGGCNNGNETSTGGGCSCSSEKGSGCCGSKASNPQMPELSKQKSGCCSNKVENPPKKSCCSSKQEEVPKSTGCCSGKSENKAVGECCSGGCKCSLPKQEKDLKEKTECDDSGFVKKFSSCLCSETKSFKHRHSEFCGHPIIFHDGHIDYIVGNQLHHVHDGHCDDHGIIFIVEKNELKSKEENNHLGLLEENYSEL